MGFTWPLEFRYYLAMASSEQLSRRGMFFVTTAIHDRRPIFETSRLADLFIDTLLHYRTRGHYKLHAFLVLPDHVHLLLTPQSLTLDQAVTLIKTGFANRLRTPATIWESGFTGCHIRSLQDLETLRNYLHQAPVRAGLTATAELYPYSSAHRLT